MTLLTATGRWHFLSTHSRRLQFLSPALVAHADGRHGRRPLARRKKVEAGNPVAFRRWHTAVQQMWGNQSRIYAPIRDVVGLVEVIRLA